MSKKEARTMLRREIGVGGRFVENSTMRRLGSKERLKHPGFKAEDDKISFIYDASLRSSWEIAFATTLKFC